MNKKYFLTFLVYLFFLTYLASENAFVFTDSLRIRDTPSMDGNVVGSISKQSITIYDMQGSKKYENGEWDYWYKISEIQEYWINAYYVATFPMYFRYDLTSGGCDYKIMNIDYQGVSNYYIVDGKYNSIRENDNRLFDKLIDNSYLRLSELIKDINRQLNFDEEKEYDPDFFDPIYFKNIESLVLLYGIGVSTDLKTLYSIIGNPSGGGEYIAVYSISDLGKSYSLHFHVDYERAFITKIVYTIGVDFR